MNLISKVKNVVTRNYPLFFGWKRVMTLFWPFRGWHVWYVATFQLQLHTIWSIYLSFGTIFQSLWFLFRFTWICRLLPRRKLLNQGFQNVKKKSSLCTFNCPHHVNQYVISVSQMITQMFCLSYHNLVLPPSFMTYH